jgi:hypothetical protein
VSEKCVLAAYLSPAGRRQYANPPHPKKTLSISCRRYLDSRQLIGWVSRDRLAKARKRNPPKCVSYRSE